MSHSFDYYQFEEKDERSKIPALTGSTIYCPKCGTENYFEESFTRTELRCFCQRCSTVLNEYWNNYFENLITTCKCANCHGTTFNNTQYCVWCGNHCNEANSKKEGLIESLRPKKYYCCFSSNCFSNTIIYTISYFISFLAYDI